MELSILEDIILIERRDNVALVTLNRPETLNALNLELRKAICATFKELSEDSHIRAVVLTGAGRSFTVGLDLKEVGRIGLTGGAAPQDIDIESALSNYPWPIIGAINGFAITGGFELALCCDILYGSTEARFADTHALVGVVPGWGLSQKLSRLIGVSRAKELSFSGNFLDATTAEKWGLLNRVFEPHHLVPEALKLADTITKTQSNLLRIYKKLIDDGFDTTLANGMELEKKRSAEFAESVKAESVEEARKTVTKRGRDLNS